MRHLTVLLVLASAVMAFSNGQANESIVAENVTTAIPPESVGDTKDQYLTKDVEEDVIDLDDKAIAGDENYEIAAPVQSGPFIDLFGPTLLSLKMVDETHAQMVSNYTNDVLLGRSVVGVYFSADW